MRAIKRLLTAFFLFLVFTAKADEGMWLPLFLQQLNEKQMKAMGMKISAADIYNINKGSLKDAIVSFGGFCTGEVISEKGLVLTNHHCGFDAIQNHSTLERNYIRDGFWARSNSEEIPNPGLFVTFIVRIEDVSKAALAGVNEEMKEAERQSRLDKNIAEIRRNLKKEATQDSYVRSFFEGNQYFLFVTETYRDIRLVGAPPSAIGNFGKDTDNWMWPRHTGDFSLFRIYAGKDNKPAEYSLENVPYKPKKALAISMAGMKEGDFTMVFGFPGRTTQYLHSEAVDQIVKLNDPVKIAIRDKALSVIDGFMRKDEQVKIQYAAKYASISNAWKKWQGEVLGLSSTKAVEKKKNQEAVFRKRVEANPAFKAAYGSLLDDLQNAYQELSKYGVARDYFTETMSRIEAFAIGSQLNNLRSIKEKNGEQAYKDAVPRISARLEDLYKEYNPAVDKKLFEVLLEKFTKDQPEEFLAPELRQLAMDYKNDFGKMADDFYINVDLLNNGAKVLANLQANPDLVLAANDMNRANQLFQQLNTFYAKTVTPKLSELQARVNRLQRTYMKAQMEVMKEKTFYPDANSTLRVTYGNVKGYQPRDAVKYDFYTYLDGVMDKYKPGDYEFDVPEKLRTLYKNKDFGPYGKNGKMPVCFIAMNHTTGGNSGSPALDARGNLVGLNFDRVWEGTMSDINYDPSICRNIMVDIRYVLFIIDKYADAGHLVKEMKLVYPGK
ncbi:MAG: S46 family peptidase [Chitinophagaceae bacterium]|nr:S46 family peptidase [Chitinophagaceae bacterium]